MKFLFHCGVLALSFGLVFLWNISPASDFTIQALAALVILYILITVIRRKKHPEIGNFGTTTDIFILNTAILLLISTTGQIYSPLFFLLYFLGFGITFIFEPATVFLYVIGAILVFLPEALKNGSLESFLRLGSIALISPLAFFFGQNYKDRDQEEAEIEAMTERTHEAADTIS